MPQVICARCKRDYRDQYDSCPWCGMRREKASASTGPVAPASRQSTPASAAPGNARASRGSASPAAPQAPTTVSAPTIASQTPPGESLTLGRVLMSVAVIWGLIGLANVVNVFVTGSSAAARSFAAELPVTNTL